jgi:hypothetical protein
MEWWALVILGVCVICTTIVYACIIVSEINDENIECK